MTVKRPSDKDAYIFPKRVYVSGCACLLFFLTASALGERPCELIRKLAFRAA